MHDPLPTADPPAEIETGVWRWAAFSPFHRVELAAHAVLHAGELVLFDPLPLAGPVRQRLRELAPAGRILLTNGNHRRAAADWGRELGLPVWAPAPALFPGDPFGSGALPAGWAAIPLPGGAPGETAFHHRERSLVVFGDAVVHLPERGLELLPDKYCTDPRQLRASLAGLPAFERALFAHGQPIGAGAGARIAALL